MKSLVLVSALATAAFAQSSASSAAASAPSANPLIPTGISDGCTSFLNLLNGDSSLSSCTSSLIDASKQFGPGANSTSAPSAGTISTALNSICSASSSACSDTTLQGKLTDFYSACSAELTSNPNKDVLRTYDVLYAISPLRKAVCTKDDKGSYCVNQAKAATPSGVSDAKVNVAVSSGPDLSSLKQYLWSQNSVAKRAAAQTAAIIPNVTTYHDSNLLFLFLTPETASAQLCTTCTRNILMSYIQFQTAVPYAPGIGQSPLMSGQPDLYNAVTSKCGKSFFQGGVQAAGGISSGTLGDSSASPRSASQDFGMVSMAMGVLVLGFAYVL